MPSEFVTECHRGHAYTSENTGYTSEGRRYCRTCHAARQRLYYQAQKQKRELEPVE